MKTRIEHDLLGEKEVPADAYYGIQTLRGIENFQNISGITIGDYPNYVKALAMVKWAAAKANQELEILPDDIANAITRACEEIIGGKLHDQFPVDLIQGGAGTSTNMNINEVVVRVTVLVFTFLVSNQFQRPVSNHFIDIHIGRSKIGRAHV